MITNYQAVEYVWGIEPEHDEQKGNNVTKSELTAASKFQSTESTAYIPLRHSEKELEEDVFANSWAEGFNDDETIDQLARFEDVNRVYMQLLLANVMLCKLCTN